MGTGGIRQEIHAWLETQAGASLLTVKNLLKAISSSDVGQTW